MKNPFVRGVAGVCRLITVASIIYFPARCVAQDNVWTSATGGNWHDLSWSLGILPGTNQTIWVTNYGWKAIQIGAATALSFPQSLNVDSITVSSPTNSFNTLLLNYAGSSVPLTVKSLTVASNSALTMFSSALQINGPNGSGAMIGGEFNQNDSVVAGNQINVGYIGSGVYNFNSGYFTVSHLWLGGFGATPGVFNQNGGTNGFGITHLDGGTYVLSNGWYGATIYFNYGQFQQFGGILATDLTIYAGGYVLAGGVHQGSLTVPSYNQFTTGNGSMLQSGGTNYGSFDIGSEGYGSYTMSDGVSYAGSIFLGHGGSYHQSGGLQIIAGTISIDEQQVNWEAYEGGSLELDGGQMSSSGLISKAYYTQTGGTNSIAGDVLTGNGEDTRLSVSGGLMTANNLTASPSYVGGVSVTGGTLIITNTLSVGGVSSFPFWQGFSGGGQLVVSNIWLSPDAIFSCRDGVINQSGTLTLGNASLYSGTNTVQFGQLCLADGGSTNSTLYMVSPASVMSFADSTSITWSNEATLMIEGWSGSLTGGGQQQIVFGKNANALTDAQVHQIQFHDPAGLAAGMYSARMLATGEIVPESNAAPAASMALTAQSNGMHLELHGEAGHTYSIETSTDLVHWVTWTNQVNSTGTITVTDTDATNCPMRFYRARLMP